ncbi:NAD(P)-dependent oxidoreductase [Spirochaeta africana]|uniref:Beta-hydroxyacid dehydrogenase, 3-hydroxyisobutyrate dehydrogenase n=1 Tax=Spirochaeta africana (strain ATCC 700263 / DSM 8902 / Z-7692) TaxID=889378 RepID=H9UIZ4_SPIAZ|nr:NAD(P)-dependent oxidoreductase [Spirochaeta africana]AFG37487.1 beta-hydroxyacid dehydrogenase, 3-hydroxyisobutyrate dehydrogenase [Spirochaeta africana DSM 8902]
MGKVTVAWIGTGIMGAPMCAHICAAGHRLRVYNRTPEKAQPLLDLGATWCNSPAEAARDASVVFTMLGYPEDVEQVYIGTMSQRGLIDAVAPRTVCIDMTTSSPEIARRVDSHARQHQVFCLDAPVSGGMAGAQAGSLAIMAGGDAQAFSHVRPLLRLLGPDPLHMGPAGSGQHAKMANQILIASTMMGVTEALEYARSKNLPIERLIPLLGSGAAGSWSWNNLAPRMYTADYAAGFYVKHFLKDLRIALQEARRSRLELPGLAQAAVLYERLEQMGYGDSGTQVLPKAYTRAE